jgi:hypothetical protein
MTTVKQRGGVGGHCPRCFDRKEKPMEASAIQEDALHAALHSIIEDRESYSPAGLALEVTRAIDSAYPECMGAFAHLAYALICHEGERPSIFTVIEDLGHVVTARAAEEAGL